MNEINYIETTDRTNLTEMTKFRIDEISKIEIIFTNRLIKEKSAVKN